MGQVTVTGKIDVNLSTGEGSVLLSGSPPPTNPQPGEVFFVKTGDKLKWVFRDKTGTTVPAIGDFKLRIRLDSFVKANDEDRPNAAALIDAPSTDQGKIFTAQNHEITGNVLLGALRGHYRYAVELVKSGQAPIVLRCFWTTDDGRTDPAAMAGGEKGGAPRNP